jgi:hypothetical protein
LLHNELCDGTWSLELSCVISRLKILEDFFVDVTEHVTVIGRIEVDSVNLIDNLPHEGAVLHVVVGILEGHSDQASNSVCPP